jgi:hypothetical protein
MKKLSIILASLVLSGSILFAAPAIKQEKAKTEKKEDKKADKKEVKKVPTKKKEDKKTAK